ncbi:sulfatase [Puniceicoccales bacterium CK1056]|uniref:Sulfatase n=1 Tax=Oceanipulchritudo coccoides TaxID=2706888 RepID=A0A6B2M1R4_9BACT|nr:sulfatase [Oceanipulchritudo coccoides]NDV62017.1 sulfatase [Oceanipulchritudo coccoides]
MKNILSLLLLCSATLHGKAPNIVFVFSDDHATQAIGAYGHVVSTFAPTPHLDRLAQKGMRFDRCLVTNSICGPSRATILTGKYSHLNGFYFNEATEFDGSQVTFPKLLQEAGYQTSLIGKWHLASEPTGFEHWEVLPGQGLYYKPEFEGPDGVVTEDGYVTDVVTDKAIHWLEQERDPEKPFMLMVQHKAPHREWSPPVKYLDLFDGVVFPEPETLFDDYRGRTTASHDQDMTLARTFEKDKDLKVDVRRPDSIFYQRVYSRLSPEEQELWDRNLDQREAGYNDPDLKGVAFLRLKYQSYLRDYLACVRSLDDNIGRLQDYLETSGLAENTVFIYSSDQGFYLGEHGWFDKRFMYDESYRTPLLISWPGVTKAGSVNSDLVSNLDFAQTFLEIAGVPAPEGMQGASLVPALTGKTPDDWRDYHYYHYYEYPGWHMVQRHEGVYDGRYKLIHFYDLDEWELIDTESDPHELTSQYFNPEYTPVKERMHRALDRMKERYDVPPGIPAPREDVDPMQYYSTERRLIELSKKN